MVQLTLADMVTPDRVLWRLQAARKRQVVRALAAPLARISGIGSERVEQAVLARGDLTSLGIGRGLAIPHATLPGLERPIGAFAGLEAPVDFGAADGLPADLVLLILAPEGEDTSLLRALAGAARRLRDREVAEKLRGAATAEAAHAVLTTEAWRAGRGPDDAAQPPGRRAGCRI